MWREDDVDGEVDARVEEDEIVGQALDVEVQRSVVVNERQQQSLYERRRLTDDEHSDDDDQHDGDAIIAHLLTTVSCRRVFVQGGRGTASSAHCRQQVHRHEHQRQQRHDVHYQEETDVLVHNPEPEIAAYLRQIQLSRLQQIIASRIMLCQ